MTYMIIIVSTIEEEKDPQENITTRWVPNKFVVTYFSRSFTWELDQDFFFIELKSHKEMFNVKSLLSYRLNTFQKVVNKKK